MHIVLLGNRRREVAIWYDIIPYTEERLPSLGEGGWGRVLGRFLGDEWLPVWPPEGGFETVVDLRETEKGYELSAEVPGLKPEEIEVVLSGDLLTIKGEKREEREEDKGGYHLVERRFGSFHRSFRLPEAVEREHLSATHKDGVLRVVLPKLGKEESTRIEVKPS